MVIPHGMVLPMWESHMVSPLGFPWTVSDQSQMNDKTRRTAPNISLLEPLVEVLTLEPS